MEIAAIGSRPSPEFNFSHIELIFEQLGRASSSALKQFSDAASLRTASALNASGLAEQLGRASSSALKQFSDAASLTLPKLGYMERFTEQIGPVLDVSASLGEQVRLSALSPLGLHAHSSLFSTSWSDYAEDAESLILEPARSGDHQLGFAGSAIEWSEEWQNALAKLLIILMALAAIVAFGTRTKVAAVDEFMVAAQIVFYSIPYAVSKNPLLSSVWFWVPVYWFVRTKE